MEDLKTIHIKIYANKYSPFVVIGLILSVIKPSNTFNLIVESSDTPIVQMTKILIKIYRWAREGANMHIPDTSLTESQQGYMYSCGPKSAQIDADD